MNVTEDLLLLATAKSENHKGRTTITELVVVAIARNSQWTLIARMLIGNGCGHSSTYTCTFLMYRRGNNLIRPHPVRGTQT